MLIREMNAQECRNLLARLSMGRLACAKDDQPYVVPIFFAYEPDRLCGVSTVGQKLEWIRDNTLVCVEADEVLAHNHWESVVVLGRYEEPAGQARVRRGPPSGPVRPRKASLVVADRILCFAIASRTQAGFSGFLLHSHCAADWTQSYRGRCGILVFSWTSSGEG